MIRKGKYFVSVPIRRDESDEANDIMKKTKDIRWLDEEVSECKQCGQKLPYPTCARCKHSRVLRTIKQTLRKTWICNLRYAAITCEILEEDIDKPVKCPFFKEAQFQEYK